MGVPVVRDLPSVETLSRAPALSEFRAEMRVKASREAIRRAREALMAGSPFDLARLEFLAVEAAKRLQARSLRGAINLSGVILHTGLGRARLPNVEPMPGHVNLETDIETGDRGDRQSHVRSLLKELTGAEDALVVNNCAAALMLVLRAHCRDAEVVLSRGQMIEIGGSYRMPDIVRESGCRLVEVGCTNKTHLADYEQAIGDNTSALLRCSTSNYKIIGFTDQPDPRDLAALAHEQGILLIDDLGSGCLVETPSFGLPKERTLGEALNDGADLVTASGDKLLGGPQCGIVLGRHDLVSRASQHPLARAVRVDKLTLWALEAVLRLYSEGRAEEIPVWKYVGRPLVSVFKDARTLARAWGEGAHVETGTTELGGGSFPGAGIPTHRTGLQSPAPDRLAGALRKLDIPVVARIEKGLVWLDPRTAESDEVKYVAKELPSIKQSL